MADRARPLATQRRKPIAKLSCLASAVGEARALSLNLALEPADVGLVGAPLDLQVGPQPALQRRHPGHGAPQALHLGIRSVV